MTELLCSLDSGKSSARLTVGIRPTRHHESFELAHFLARADAFPGARLMRDVRPSELHKALVRSRRTLKEAIHVFA
jgi:hypothetical protein